MDPHQASFDAYHALPPGYYVQLADDTNLCVHGVGTMAICLQDKWIQQMEVLHLPDLCAPPYSISMHHHHLRCAFIANKSGVVLSFPMFILEIDDSTECILPYSTCGLVPSHSFDYIETLLSTKLPPLALPNNDKIQSAALKCEPLDANGRQLSKSICMMGFVMPLLLKKTIKSMWISPS